MGYFQYFQEQQQQAHHHRSDSTNSVGNDDIKKSHTFHDLKSLERIYRNRQVLSTSKKKKQQIKKTSPLDTTHHESSRIPRKTMGAGKRPMVQMQQSKKDIEALVARSERKQQLPSILSEKQRLAKKLHRIKRRLLLERASMTDSDRTVQHNNLAEESRDLEDTESPSQDSQRHASYDSFPDYSDDSSNEDDSSSDDDASTASIASLAKFHGRVYHHGGARHPRRSSANE